MLNLNVSEPDTVPAVISDRTSIALDAAVSSSITAERAGRIHP